MDLAKIAQALIDETYMAWVDEQEFRDRHGITSIHQKMMMTVDIDWIDDGDGLITRLIKNERGYILWPDYD